MYQYVTRKWHNSAMETRDHSKNGASLKSHTSKGKLIEKFGILILAIGLAMIGCKEDPSGGDDSSGSTQVPRILSPSDKSSSNIGEQMNVSVSGNNIEVKYVGLNGSPEPSNTNESEKGFYTGFMYEQDGNKFYFTPNNAIWSNKWVKIIAHDKNSDKWSEPVYVKIQGTMQPTYENSSPANSGNTGYWLRVNGGINAIHNYDKIPTVKNGSLTLLELPIRGIYFSNYTYSKNGDGSVQLSFTAHNNMVGYGKISVCNANGVEIESRIIKPFSGNITGVFDWFVEGWELVKDFGSMFTGQWAAMNAKETKIEITIPKDGFLTITNDSSIEGLTFACNLISIVSNAVSIGTAYNTDFSNLTASDFQNLSSETFLPIFSQEFSKSIIYSLKDFHKLTNDDIDVILQFALEFCSSDEGINLLKYLLVNEARNALSSAADASIAKLSMGASSVVFGIGKVSELRDQIKSMASSWNDGYVKITNQNDDGLTEDIHNIIPPDILEKFKELGTEINGGKNPPNIEGAYIVSPLTLVKSNFTDWAPGTVYPINNGIMNLKFSEQNNANLTVKMDYDMGSEQYGSGLGAFITGEGNKFSVFVVAEGYQGGWEQEETTIFSGAISETGILNLTRAVIQTIAAPTTIQRGQGRLWKDGDGFSERK